MNKDEDQQPKLRLEIKWAIALISDQTTLTPLSKYIVSEKSFQDPIIYRNICLEIDFWKYNHKIYPNH